MNFEIERISGTSYHCLQNLDLSLEALPVLDLGSGDLLDGSLLAGVSVGGGADSSIGALAKLL